MKDMLLEKLIAYFGEDYDASLYEGKLKICVERAINTFTTFRNYPKNYFTREVSDGVTAYDEDLKKHIYLLFDLALFFFVKQGTEFENNHHENGDIRVFSTEQDIYIAHGAVPFVRM